MAEIKSKHGVILSCTLSHEGVDGSLVNGEFHELTKALEGNRYGFVDNSAIEGRTAGGRSGDVWKWLETVMEH
jgi:lipoate-protein ligase A